MKTLPKPFIHHQTIEEKVPKFKKNIRFRPLSQQNYSYNKSFSSNWRNDNQQIFFSNYQQGNSTM